MIVIYIFTAMKNVSFKNSKYVAGTPAVQYCYFGWNSSSAILLLRLEIQQCNTATSAGWNSNSAILLLQLAGTPTVQYCYLSWLELQQCNTATSAGWNSSSAILLLQPTVSLMADCCDMETCHVMFLLFCY
jgi:hypothetical protein